jgi:hypothetical protein
MVNWQKKLDDLAIDEKIEVDLGDTLVCGRYQGLSRGEGGVWYLVLSTRRGRDSEYVKTSLIQNLAVLT